MGGKTDYGDSHPGWPINTLSPDIAREVTEGAFYCRQAGRAGGRTPIDAPEPIWSRGHRRSADRTGEEKQYRAGGMQTLLTKTVGDWRADHRRRKKSLLKPEHQAGDGSQVCR